MQSYLAPQNGPWLELLLVLAGGTMVIVGVACLVVQFVRCAIWQRTIWQIATAAVLTLVLVELTGTGPASVRLWRARIRGLLRDNVVPCENSPAREGGVGRVDISGTLPSRAGLSANARIRTWSSTSPKAAATGPRAALPPIEEILRPAIAPGEQPEGGSQNVLEQDADEALPAKVQVNSAEEAPPYEPPVPPASWWLGTLWALGAVLIAARTVCSRALLFAFRRRRTPAGDPILWQRVGTLAQRLGIRRRVCVLEAAGLRSPVAFGSFWPTVALPVTFADDFDRRQQDAVLAHELAHLAAHDPAWQVVADLLCAALWWHPLAWWLRHRLRAASEAAADEASLLVPGGSDLLADCLVAMGRRLVRGRELGWLSVEGPGFRSSLGRRVERLLDLGTRAWRAPGRGRLLLAKTTLPAALVIVAVCCTAWARPQATLTEGETTMNVLTNSWRHSLAAAAVAFFTAGYPEALADGPAIEGSTPAVVGEDLADAHGQLALLAEDEEGEAGEREEREREEIEARERDERERDEAQGRKRREREERELYKSETLMVELKVLETKARDFKRALEGLRDGQDEKARELQAALREVDERMDAIRGKLRGGERDRLRRELGREERAELEVRLQDLTQEGRALHGRRLDIQRKLEKVKLAGQVEDARQMNRMLHEVRAEAERVEAEVHEIMRQLGRREERPRPDRPQPEREQLRMHLDELRAVISRLKEAGRPEEAAERLREEREILRQLEQDLEPWRPGPPEDLEKRIGHLKAAIDNLHAAGLHEQAEQLAQQMERLVGEHRRGEGAPEFRHPPRPAGQPPHPELGQRLQQQDRAIHELNAAVKELRQEMGQMREMLQELLGRRREGGR